MSVADFLSSIIAGTKTVPVSVQASAPVAANILTGYTSLGASSGPNTLITIPAGRTWVGKIFASVACANNAAVAATGVAEAIFSIVGTGATPAAGNILAVKAKSAANAATGTVGTGGANSGQMDLTVIAPAGNSVTIAIQSVCIGSSSIVDASAVGQLL